MNNKTRIISTLLIGHSNLYKTKKFSKLILFIFLQSNKCLHHLIIEISFA